MAIRPDRKKSSSNPYLKDAKAKPISNDKVKDLDTNIEKGVEDALLTTNTGLPVNDDQNSLKAGARGPSPLEDFHLREKIPHFDHGRIPERVVHARGSAAHGFFQVYESLASLTKAKSFRTLP